MSCIRGDDVAEAKKKKTKMRLFDHGCVIHVEIIVFFYSLFSITDNFLSLVLSVIYICKELSIATNFSPYSVFLYISNSPGTILCLCILSKKRKYPLSSYFHNLCSKLIK